MDWRKGPHSPPLSSSDLFKQECWNLAEARSLLGQRKAANLCSFPWYSGSLKGAPSYHWFCPQGSVPSDGRNSSLAFVHRPYNTIQPPWCEHFQTGGSTVPWTHCYQGHIFIYRKKAESLLKHPRVISHLPPSCNTENPFPFNLHISLLNDIATQRGIMPDIDFENTGIMLIYRCPYSIRSIALYFSILGNSIFWRIWIQ